MEYRQGCHPLAAAIGRVGTGTVRVQRKNNGPGTERDVPVFFDMLIASIG